LRHYYANTQIMLDRDIYKLAVRMGTSVTMIEQYFGTTITRRDAGMAAGLHDAQRDVLRATAKRDLVKPVPLRDNPTMQDQHDLEQDSARERQDERDQQGPPDNVIDWATEPD
jgi:hypothetical protein